jgi:hypothetical protein
MFKKLWKTLLYGISNSVNRTSCQEATPVPAPGVNLADKEMKEMMDQVLGDKLARMQTNCASCQEATPVPAPGVNLVSKEVMDQVLEDTLARMQIMNNLGQKHFLVVDIDSKSESFSALRDTSPATGDYYVLLVTKAENGFIVFDLVKIPIDASTETTDDTLTSSLNRSVIEAQRQKATKARIEKDLKRIKGKKSKENFNKRRSKNGRA